MRRWLGPVAWAAASLACGSTRLDDSLTDAPTRLRVDPDAFEGDVACVPGAQGALQSYVVTFEQVSLGALSAGVDAGALPPPVSSPPVPCNRATLYTAVGGQFYAADIVGFDREVSASDVGQVAPAWSASCGRGTPDLAAESGPDPLGPTEAIFNYTVPMNGCTSFVRSGSAGEPGSLVVDQASALGQLRCGSGPGQVSHFEGVLGGTRVSAACGAPLTFAVEGAARFYTISLTAFEGGPSGADAGAIDALLDGGTPSLVDAALPDAATDAGLDAGVGTAPGGSVPDAGVGDAGASGGVARWRTQCIGRAVPGVSAVATCDPLASISP
jgi:hypothetical protein